MSRIRAALLAFLWGIIIYYGKQGLLDRLEPLTLVPSLALTFLLAAVFVIPCCILLMGFFPEG